MIDSVLVANRGEIAVRIFKTCRRLGIRTVAVYSDADAHSLHVAEADAAMHIGASPASESYLNQRAILKAARESRVRAIHPGYGFLSENPDFAQSVIDAGIAWIGPPPSAMRALGDKARAKTLARLHDVPVLAGYEGDDQAIETLERESERVGYPLLIKASAGGGGRGMRVVESPTAFEEALAAAKREALNSFGDDRVLLERYVPRPRHIEIQIMGDLHGHLIHLGERECSIQRRHQKLIEETPSSAVDAELRHQMGEAALRLARAAGYANAGTVEFLLEQSGEFAFLEVNARLQVEHPVTETVTGLDLVELQIRAAAGERVELSQSDVTFKGHAIEVRVIAEDPVAGFLPSTGTIERLSFPESTRIDTWVRQGTIVSPYYDSLLAKVIAHGANRTEAAETLASALSKVEIVGLSHNVDLLLAAIEEPAFLSGALDTGFLEEHDVAEGLTEVPSMVMAAVCANENLRSRHGDPWRATTGWRVGRIEQPGSWTRAGRVHVAGVSARSDDTVEVDVGSSSHTAQLVTEGRVAVDAEILKVKGNDSVLVHWLGRTYRLRRASALSVESTARDRGAQGASGSLVAPMPGRVVKISVALGEQVTQNQPLVVLEAMKMEHVVEAPHAGTVTELAVGVGDQLVNGQRLLTIGSAP